jgi:hypothetical protein
MAISDEIKRQDRQRAGGICECTSKNCFHYARCKAKGVELHRRQRPCAGVADSAANVQFLCKTCLIEAKHTPLKRA